MELKLHELAEKNGIPPEDFEEEIFTLAAVLGKIHLRGKEENTMGYEALGMRVTIQEITEEEDNE